MSINKLRSREDSDQVTNKIQKKVEVKKPMSFNDDLKARLLRRQGLVLLVVVFYLIL